MQTENIVEECKTENTVAADNLAAFVDFAVGTQDMHQQQMLNATSGYQDPNVKIDTMPDNLGNQFTLVMQQDGSEGYLIALDPSQEQIVSSEPEIQTLPTADELNEQVVSAAHVYSTPTTVAEEVVDSNLIIQASNIVNNVLEHAVVSVANEQRTITAGACSNEVGQIKSTNYGNFIVSQDTNMSASQDTGENKQLNSPVLNSLGSTASDSVVDNQIQSTGQESVKNTIISAQDTPQSGQIHIVK